MSARYPYHVRYVHRGFARLRRNRGNRCRVCGARHTVRNPLQFAHRRPTGLMGMSRGQERRMRDIQKNPRKYVLLCRSCHMAFDRGVLHPPNTNRRWGWRCDVLGGDERRRMLTPASDFPALMAPRSDSADREPPAAPVPVGPDPRDLYDDPAMIPWVP